MDLLSEEESTWEFTLCGVSFSSMNWDTNSVCTAPGHRLTETTPLLFSSTAMSAASLSHWKQIAIQNRLLLYKQGVPIEFRSNYMCVCVNWDLDLINLWLYGKRTYSSFTDAVWHIEEIAQPSHWRNSHYQTSALSHHQPGRVNWEEIVAPAR